MDYLLGRDYCASRRVNGDGRGHTAQEGGATPLEQMIAAADRAILVTRLWYIREVDPYEKIFTGMVESVRLDHVVPSGSVALTVASL